MAHLTKARLFLAGLLVSLASLPLHALTYSWQGGFGNNWSEQKNWNPEGVPGAGDTLAFPQIMSMTGLNLNNDLPAGTAFAQLVFNGSGYRLGGNAIALSGGILGGFNFNTIDLPVEVLADQGWSGDIDFLRPVSGSARLTGSGMSTGPRFAGSHPFSGILAGRVLLRNGEFPNASYEYDPSVFPSMLAGSGVVGGAVRAAQVVPGEFQGPGDLSLGSLRLEAANFFAASFNVAMNGTVPGTGYSQLHVAGPIHLVNAQLNVTIGSSFAPAVGQVLTLIENDSGMPIVGQFNGLPEGASVTFGIYRFQLSYAGGASGQDLTLTCTFAPNVWTGTVSKVWSEAGNWSGGVPAPGAALTFPMIMSMTGLALDNDLAAGIVYDSIVFTGSGYQLGGKAIGLAGGISGGFNFNTIDMPIEVMADQAWSGDIEFRGPVSGSARIIGSGMSTGPRFSGSHPFAGVLAGRVMLRNASLANASYERDPMVFPSVLAGNGSIGGAARVAQLSPGEFGSSGLLEVGSLEFVNANGFGGNFTVTIHGSAPGTGYSRVNVGGPITIAPGTFLNVTLGGAFSPSVGEVFTLIGNQGGAPIAGEFNGLPQGAQLTLGVFRFEVSYTGGASGRDFILTCTFAPNLWTGAVSKRWSDASNWTGGVPTSGSTLTFPQIMSMTGLQLMNDLPAGLQLAQLVFTGSGYRIGGSAITLSGGISGGSSFNTIDLPIEVAGDQAWSGDIDFNGTVSGSGRITASGMGSGPRFAGTHSFGGTLAGRVLLRNASFPNASYERDSTIFPSVLAGNGTIGGFAKVAQLTPGEFQSPGILNVGSLEFVNSFGFGGNYTVVINGAEAGTGYSQVNSAGAVIIAPGTFFNVTLSPSYVPTAGDTYVVLNSAAGLVSGAFSGYAEGTVVRLNNAYDFEVRYRPGRVELVSLNGKNPTSTSVTSSANPSAPGQTVTFTATVSAPAATGEVWFRDGTTILGTAPVSGGIATFNTSTLGVGLHSITAQYRGDTGNGGSTSPPLSQSVIAEGSTPTNGENDPPVVVELTPTVNGVPTTIDLAFSRVISGGQTTVTVPPTAPAPPPSGFQFGNPPMYVDITTTATFTGTIGLCFGWSEGQFSNESAIGMWHYENGAWVDVTTLLDTNTNTVCGNVTSLSPFALMETSFAFSGFLAPVANLPASNRAKAGAAVPIKFSLGKDHGLGIFAPGNPKSSVIACNATSTRAVLEEAATAGSSALTYEPVTKEYSYVWKTDRAWAGSCRQFSIRFSDGTEAKANFDFR